MDIIIVQNHFSTSSKSDLKDGLGASNLVFKCLKFVQTSQEELFYLEVKHQPEE